MFAAAFVEAKNAAAAPAKTQVEAAGEATEGETTEGVVQTHPEPPRKPAPKHAAKNSAKHSAKDATKGPVKKPAKVAAKEAARTKAEDEAGANPAAESAADGTTGPGDSLAKEAAPSEQAQSKHAKSEHAKSDAAKPGKKAAHDKRTRHAKAASQEAVATDAAEPGPEAAVPATAQPAAQTQVASLQPLTPDAGVTPQPAAEPAATEEPAAKPDRKKAKAHDRHKAARKKAAEEKAAAEAGANEAAQVQTASLPTQTTSQGFDIVKFFSGLNQSAPPTAPLQPEAIEDAAADADSGRGKRKRYDDVAARSAISPLIAKHAAAQGVPAALADAVVRVESRYNPRAKNGPYLGLTQMHFNTARAMGYWGAPDGLFDADTNLRYGIKYLAIAYRLAGGDTCRTILKYQAGHRAESMTQAASKYCARVRTMMAAH